MSTDYTGRSAHYFEHSGVPCRVVFGRSGGVVAVEKAYGRDALGLARWSDVHDLDEFARTLMNVMFELGRKSELDRMSGAVEAEASR